MTIAPDQATSIEDGSAPANDPLPGSVDQCAVAKCAELVSGKWTLLLVRDLASGPKSYSDLESSLAGISPRTLCDRLKVLALEGIVSRTRIKGLPPRTEYALTERGMQLAPVIEAMRSVGEALLASPPDEAAAAQIAAEGCCD